MTGWECPTCQQTQVCSVFEWADVYRHRSAIRERTRRLADTLTARGVAVRPSEDAEDSCQRWAEQDRPDDANCLGPRFICAACKRAWTHQEVPA